MRAKPPVPCIFCGWQHFKMSYLPTSLDVENTCTRCERTFRRDGLGHLIGVTVERDGKKEMVLLEGMILVVGEYEVC